MTKKVTKYFTAVLSFKILVFTRVCFPSCLRARCPFQREFIPWMPSAIFGCCSIVAGLATLLLPETNKKHMPDTVGAMEKMERIEEAKKWDIKSAETVNEEEEDEKIELVTSRDEELRSENVR